MQKLYLLFVAICLSTIVSSQDLDTAWVTYFEESGHVSNNRAKITALPDNQFLFHSGWSFQDFNFHIIDENGNILRSISDFGNMETISAMVGTDDGVYVAGRTTNTWNPFVSKLDTGLNTIWHTPLYDSNGPVQSMIVDQGEIYVAGATRTIPNVNTESFIAKLNSDGDTLWTREFNRIGYSDLTDILALSDGNYLVSGASNFRVQLIKFSSVGTVIWESTSDSTPAVSGETSIIEYSNGGIGVMNIGNAFEFSSTGNYVGHEEIAKYDDFIDVFVQNDTLYLFGFNTEQNPNAGFTSQPMIQLRTLDWDSISSFIFGERALLQNGLNHAISIGDRDFVVAGFTKKAGSAHDKMIPVALRYKYLENNQGTIIEEMESESRIHVYPNPIVTGSNLRIETNTPSQASVVSIFSSTGELILDKTFVTQGTFKLDLDQPPGFYFLHVSDEFGSRHRTKLIIL